MSVIALIVLLLFLGAVLWVVNAHGDKLGATMKLIINIVVITVAVVLVLSAFGVWEEVRALKVPHI